MHQTCCATRTFFNNLSNKREDYRTFNNGFPKTRM
jgi:hypothetical protein